MPEQRYSVVGENPLDFSGLGRNPDYFGLETVGLGRTDHGGAKGSQSTDQRAKGTLSSQSSITYTNETRNIGTILASNSCTVSMAQLT